MDQSSLDALYLADFVDHASRCREHGGGLTEFLRLGQVVRLHWPADVAEQWLYDHAGNDSFLKDYGLVDLTQIKWQVEALSLDLLMEISTGTSDGDAIEYFARDPKHWVTVRQHGEHMGVAQMWDVHGTWRAGLWSWTELCCARVSRGSSSSKGTSSSARFPIARLRADDRAASPVIEIRVLD